MSKIDFPYPCCIVEEESLRGLPEGEQRNIEQNRAGLRAEWKKIFADDQAAREGFQLLVKKGCDGDNLATRLLFGVRPDERTESAADRQEQKRILAKDARDLKRISEHLSPGSDEKDRNIKAVSSYLRNCALEARVPPFALSDACRNLAAEIESRQNKAVLRALFTQRDFQWLEIRDFVERSTGKPHDRQVADLINAVLRANGDLDSDHPMTEDRLKRLAARYRENSKKWANSRQSSPPASE
jgi:hypothetical protein